LISDLISELNSEFSVFKAGGDEVKRGKYGTCIESYKISTARQEKIFGKEKGKYTLLFFRDFLENDNACNYYQNAFKRALKGYLPDVSTDDVILVVGLGNRHISADSLGAEVVKNLVVTREMSKSLPKVCACVPSVLGLTGIETADTVEAIVGKIKPNIVIFVDALCASHSSRLGRSFQISDTIITPGDGVGNARKKAVLKGVKIISIGVPFVVYSSTFVECALADAGVDLKSVDDPKLKAKLKKMTEIDRSELVTLKDIEDAVKRAGRLIARTINSVLLGFEQL